MYMSRLLNTDTVCRSVVALSPSYRWQLTLDIWSRPHSYVAPSPFWLSRPHIRGHHSPV